MIAEKIKYLRECHNMTQSELAKKLGLSRSGVNAWEMGITVPSTVYIVKLARLFHVSSDYLLGIKESSTISVEGLTEREIASIAEIIECYRAHRKTAPKT